MKEILDLLEMAKVQVGQDVPVDGSVVVSGGEPDTVCTVCGSEPDMVCTVCGGESDTVTGVVT